MAKRPSNTLLYVFLSLVALIGLYIVGSLILEDDNDGPIESSFVIKEGFQS